MNILFLTQVLPYPLVGGPKIRAYYVLRHLAAQHQVTLVSFVREDDRPEDVCHLEQFCQAVHTVPLERTPWKNFAAFIESLGTGRPAVIARDRLSAMQALLTHLARQTHFEAIHADQTSMAQYALFAQKAAPGRTRPRIVLDQHNALYLVVKRQANLERGWRRALWQREAAQLQKYEAALCQRFDHILTVSGEDRAALLALLPPTEATRIGRRMTVMPICVDPAERPLVAPNGRGQGIIHLGTMFWPPNVEGVIWFAEAILPKILSRVPEARFIIAGKNPPPEVARLATANAGLAGRVEITGYVADPESLLAQSRAFVVPLKSGAGMRVKILDAWLWGLPVISTTLGAEGIAVRPAENILLADEPDDFAGAVVRVLTEPVLAARLREAGRSWVESRYDWRQVYRHLDDVYQQL